MNKKAIITLATIATGVGIAGILYFVNKKRVQKEGLIDLYPDEENTNNDDNYEEVVPDTNVDEDITDRGTILHKFIAYLAKNGVDAEETVSICETITRIRQDIPDKFPEIKKKLFEIVNSDFDIQKTREFDNENYKIMYSSIDPCQLFVKNGFKILSMGIDCQESMMNLAEAITNLQDENPDEAISVIYELYHAFNELENDDITESTYETIFKPYVDKYVVDTNVVDTDIDVDDTTDADNDETPDEIDEAINMSFKEVDDTSSSDNNTEDK